MAKRKHFSVDLTPNRPYLELMEQCHSLVLLGRSWAEEGSLMGISLATNTATCPCSPKVIVYFGFGVKLMESLFWGSSQANKAGHQLQGSYFI